MNGSTDTSIEMKESTDTTHQASTTAAPDEIELQIGVNGSSSSNPNLNCDEEHSDDHEASLDMLLLQVHNT